MGEASKVDQERFQELMFRVQTMQKELQEMNKQLGLLEYKREEINQTIEAVKELPKTKESECFIPIGSGVFVKAELLDKKKTVVSAGAGVFAEKDNQETIVFLEGLTSKLTQSQTLLQNQIQQVQRQLEASSKEANELLGKLKK